MLLVCSVKFHGSDGLSPIVCSPNTRPSWKHTEVRQHQHRQYPHHQTQTGRPTAPRNGHCAAARLAALQASQPCQVCGLCCIHSRCIQQCRPARAHPEPCIATHPKLLATAAQLLLSPHNAIAVTCPAMQPGGIFVTLAAKQQRRPAPLTNRQPANKQTNQAKQPTSKHANHLLLQVLCSSAILLVQKHARRSRQGPERAGMQQQAS